MTNKQPPQWAIEKIKETAPWIFSEWGREVVAALLSEERERCAKIAEQYASRQINSTLISNILKNLAFDIRECYEPTKEQMAIKIREHHD